MTATLLRPSDYRIMPWKNGLGTTTEIAAEPPGGLAAGERFLWRLSLADVAADGPFSPFPGYDRTILVAEGAGMHLHFAEAPPVTVTERFQPVRFSGDWNTDCRLVDGPIRDFNVMVDRSRAAAETTILTGSGPWPMPPADTVLVVVFQGAVSGGGLQAAAGDTLRLESEKEVVLRGQADSVAALVAIRYKHQERP